MHRICARVQFLAPKRVMGISDGYQSPVSPYSLIFIRKVLR